MGRLAVTGPLRVLYGHGLICARLAGCYLEEISRKIPIGVDRGRMVWHTVFTGRGYRPATTTGDQINDEIPDHSDGKQQIDPQGYASTY